MTDLHADEVVRQLRELGYDPQPGWPHAENVQIRMAAGRATAPLTPELQAFIDAGRWPEVNDWLEAEKTLGDIERRGSIEPEI